MLERMASVRSRIGENMEDRYLFKAKTAQIVGIYNNGLEDGVWVHGSLRCDVGKYTIFQFETERADYVEYEIDPSTICQCTGLKDKNGKLIWENDIVNCLAEECCGYIGWNEDEAGFYFNVLLEDGTYEEEHIYDYVDCMEIIGNTFDNMELLERSIE